MDAAKPARRGPKPNAQTRQKLIEAGLKEIHANGFAATGIQKIVDDINVPKGSFYNYFDSKEAFGAEVCDRYSEQALARLTGFLADADKPPLRRLKAYFDDRAASFALRGFVQGCVLGNFSAETVDHSELIRQHVATHFRRWSGVIAACLAEAQRDGALAGDLPADTLADFILNSWEGALLRMRAERGAAPLEAFKQMVFDTLLHGRAH
ncbi:TetR/AcrR family transcriptional regulator [Rhizobium sp. WYJ-E13]|uniref:TetR/AcrR family transcriptional regulator n=1 Tax=Rhizobium sp. WYJ-E13 TaxID=2849093 RepID=UPI001C1F03F1|nr:TetR/AcrR family transcriptional regulator [Rhizobium sp. WYJ-E13]QWW69787.1 TetR/AcrR family transcriptional regulator [Rhizobium sp. WYJ-E13]